MGLDERAGVKQPSQSGERGQTGELSPGGQPCLRPQGAGGPETIHMLLCFSPAPLGTAGAGMEEAKGNLKIRRAGGLAEGT